MAFELLVKFVDADLADRRLVKGRLISWLEAIGRFDYVEGVVDGIETPLIQTEELSGQISEERLDVAPVALFEQTEGPCRDLLARMHQEFGGFIRGQITEILDDSWSQCWMESFVPLTTDKFFIVPLGDPSSTPGGRTRVELYDGNGVFGTGQHATTRAVTKLLETHLPAWGASSLLDVGTGTGIYLILASLMGVKDLVGTELSEDLVAVARENCDIAGVRADIRATPALCFERSFDVIIANILAPVLHQLMPDMLKHLKFGGKLVLAGFIEKEERALISLVERCGLRLVTTTADSGWRCLAFSHN